MDNLGSLVSAAKKKKIYIYIYISLYNSNKFLIFKKVSTRNILETMLWYNKNLIIITTL
jgi:hypothetical protein